MENWYEWQAYVNEKIDEFVEWKKRREQDLEMQNLRMQRLLDAAIQRIGGLEGEIQELQEKNAYLEREVA